MIRKLAPYTKGYRVWIFLGVLCSAGEAVLELLLPKAMSQIVDVGIANGDKAYILATGLKMILMALASLVMGVGAAGLAAKAGMGFGANVRAAEYAQVQRFSFANIERFSTASLITRLTNDVSSVQMTLMMGMRMLVRAPVMLITALVMALRISLQLSQIFLVILPLLALMFIIGMIWNRASILPLLTALVYAPLYLLRTGDWRGTIALALIFPAMLWAHRSNFARWREGKEQTFRQFLFGRHEPQREEAGE